MTEPTGRTTSGQGPAREPLPPGTWPLVITLMLGVFIGALDLAIVAPALLTIQADLGVDERAAAWLFTAFVLASVAALPVMGALSDRFGRRPVYVANIAVFGAGSLVAALAPSFDILVLARVIQGIGAGGLFPVASATVGDVVPIARRGAFLGLIGAVWGVASLAGPPIGGVLTQALSWHWIFLVNLPVCLVVILLALRYVPAVRRGADKPFDVAGLVLLVGALTALVFGVSQLDGTRPLLGLGEPLVLGSLAVAVIAGAAWVWVEGRVPAPIVRLALLRRRQLVLANGLAVSIGTMEAALLFVPAFAALRLGVDTQTAALYALAGALALGIGTPVVGLLLDRLGSRLVLLAGATLTGLGMLWVSLLAADPWSFIGALVVGGFGFAALLGVPLRYIVTNETGPGERSTALAVQSIFTTTGIALGAALTGAVVASAPDAVVGFGWAYLGVAGVAVIALVLALFLKGRGAERTAAVANQRSQPGTAEAAPAG